MDIHLLASSIGYANMDMDGIKLNEKEESSSKCLVTRKLKELEMMDRNNVDLVLDIEESEYSDDLEEVPDNNHFEAAVSVSDRGDAHKNTEFGVKLNKGGSFNAAGLDETLSI
ncbi:hypothetical protein Tco_0991473 [Tanacetum coccineum]|uniref:Uncharacterized protein n=1 Tax=Tanacetum coccineum TaxID=301880 RepID=A0ABQ5F0F2_9ASTR